MVGIGFAFTENILYLAGAYMGGTGDSAGGLGSATGLFVVRGVFSPFAHPLFTSFTGIGVGDRGRHPQPAVAGRRAAARVRRRGRRARRLERLRVRSPAAGCSC